MGGKQKIGTDIDKDIRGSLWAGHVEETPGMQGSYFNIGKAGRPEDVEFYDVHGNKRSGTAAEIGAVRDIFNQRMGGGSANADPNASGGGVGAPGTGLTGRIEEMLGQGLSGQNTRFGDETMSRLKGQAFETGQSRLGQQLGTINAEAASEGVGGAAVAALRQGARSSTAKDYSGAVRDLQNQKVQADYEDRKAALKDAMDYVNSTREYELGKAKNQIDRDRIESEAAVARERIQSESSMLDRQLAAQAEMQANAARAAASGQNRGQQFQMQMANLRHSWDLENRTYEQPYRLASLGLQYT